MLFFGHVGIGEFLARPFSKGLPVQAVLLGTVLPDLIDKSIYYIPSILTGRHGAQLGFISGTRTIGHSFLFLLLFSIFSLRSRKPFFIGLSLGMATHIPLDVIADFFRGREDGSPEASSLYAYFFPFLGFRFPVLPYENLGEHAMKLLDPTIIGTELLGIGFLAHKFRRQLKRLFSGSVGLVLLGVVLALGGMTACGPGLDTPNGLLIGCSTGDVGTGASSGATSAPSWAIAVNDLYAQPFKTPCAGNFSKLSFFGNNSGSTSIVNLQIYSNDTTNIQPSGAIASCTLTVNPSVAGEMICSLSQSVFLSSSNLYWFVISSSGAFSWWTATQGSSLPRVSKIGVSPWTSAAPTTPLWFKLN